MKKFLKTFILCSFLVIFSFPLTCVSAKKQTVEAPLEDIWNHPIYNGYYKITNAEQGFERSGINSETSFFVEWGKIINSGKSGKYDIPNGYEIRIVSQGKEDYTFRPGDKTTFFAWRKKVDPFLSFKPYEGAAYTRWSGEIKASDDQNFIFELAEGQTDRKYVTIKNATTGKYLYKNGDGFVRSDGASSKEKNAQWLFIPYSFLGEMLDENGKPINPAS